MAKNEVATVSRYYVPNLGTRHYLCRGVREGGIKGWVWPILFQRKGVGQTDFHDGWGWVIVTVFCKESHSLQFMWKI